MNLRTHLTHGPRHWQSWLGRFFIVLTLLLGTLGPLSFSVPQTIAATPYTLTINVNEYPGGGPLDFSYLVNVDNTGDPFDPDPMMHPSVHPMASYSPIAAAGNGSGSAVTIPLDAGRYLVSVRSADHKLWGQHVTIPLDDIGGNINVNIELSPEPLPLSAIRVKVFHDWAPVNGFPDFPLEANGSPDMSGFHVVIDDAVGEVTVDWFGNPICTEYLDFPGGTPAPHTGGYCLTDANGDLTIPNLPFGKYKVNAIPPEPNADSSHENVDWVQTTTFEGTHIVDAWQEEGTEGNGAPGEILLEPNVATAYFFGFTAPCNFGNTGDTCPNNDTAGGFTITGRARNMNAFPPFEQLVLSDPVYRPWATLTDLGTDDQQRARVRGDEDGNFTFTGVPPGTYEISIWDDPLDYIQAYYLVTVSGSDVDLGDVGVFRWFGWVGGDVFLDNGLQADQVTPVGAADNAIRDCFNPAIPTTCELGLPALDLDIRFRDGSVKSAAFTDPSGYYEFPEARGPLGKFEIAEVGFGRFQRTGHSVGNELRLNNPDGDHDGDSIPNSTDPDLAGMTPVSDELGGGLLLNQLSIEGDRSEIDWGKRPHDLTVGENGGITGIVFYATTRNEWDARLALNEDYEPGVPDVTINLYGVTGFNLDGSPIVGPLLNTVNTDAWSHPNLTNPGNATPGFTLSECDVIDQDGNILSDIVGSVAQLIGDNCIEVPMVRNETKAGAFDGGYAFETVCTSWLGDVCTSESPLLPGNYVVEVVPPDYYQVLKEEDQNTDEGDELVPLVPPRPCVGPDHLVVDPRNPFDGQMMPLCNMRLVRVQPGANPAADFFLFTTDDPYNPGLVRDDPANSWVTSEAVPPPGRFFGLVEDDLRVNTNPNSITYGEPRGVPHLPIGIYDYAGRLMTTVYTDENGFYEVLLPSTQSTVCPIPSGVCPGMYVLVINDPGSAATPNAGFSVDYLTEPAVRDVWPGKMTPADTPVDPINALVCGVPVGYPHIFVVDDVVFTAGAGGPLTITGTRFGTTATPPVVTLDDGDGITDPVTLSIVTWTPADPSALPDPIYEDVVTVTVPSGLTPGPAQLNVISPSGHSALSGLSIHLTGGAYTPPVVTVSPPVLLTDTPIQDAIDAAAPGSLIVVEPGGYLENVILYKNVKLQGFGPGGVVGAPEVDRATPEDPPPTPFLIDPPFAHIQGTVIDGRYYAFDAARVAAWQALLGSVSYGGPSPAPAGAGITVLADPGEFGTDSPAPLTARPMIDGFGITASRGEAGGGIYVHAYGRNLIIGNNIFEGNSGGNGGAIALGRPLADGGLANNENDNVIIHHNRILANGGVRFAGGVGIFSGANNYNFAFNDVCGNYSVEYGGGVSHFGLSPNGNIRDNLIYFNDAFDEGGGLMIAGDFGPADPLGTGSGTVNVTHNLIQANFSNDDGGGIMALRPLHNRINIVNNFIVNNAAADIGGGVALDNASDVVVVNNSFFDNTATNTASDSDRTPNAACLALHGVPGPGLPPLGSCPHAAGLVSTPHDGSFTPPDGSTFSDPVLFNNIFRNNEALYWGVLPPEEPDFVEQMGLVSYGNLDFEVVSGAFGDAPIGCLDPRESIITVPYGPPIGGGPAFCATSNPTNIVGADPLFVSPTIMGVAAALNRLNLAEIAVTVVRDEGSFIGFSDYHLQPTSPARDQGVPTLFAVTAPADDYDHQFRPQGAGFEMGADEIPSPIFFSRDSNTTPPSVSDGDDANIYLWNGASFSLTFNASGAGSVGLPTGADVDALAMSGGAIYVSFKDTHTITGAGSVQDEDVVRCVPTTVSPAGVVTGCTWSLYFNGTALGLGQGDEDVDAFEILPDGSLIFSADDGAVEVPGVAGDEQDEDLLRCVPTIVSGAVTACSWSMYFDGSDIGLATTGSEDVDGVSVVVNGAVVDIYLSTNGSFSLFPSIPAGPNLISGGGNTVFVCRSAATGAASGCNGAPQTAGYYNGAGLSANDLDAFELP